MARSMASMWLCLGIVGIGAALGSAPSFAADGKWPNVAKVEKQPLVAATERLVQALEYVGSPLGAEASKALDAALKVEGDADCTEAVQKVLDKLCLVGVSINPESRVSLVEGPVQRELVQQGWRTFLVKVHNEAGVTAPLVPESPNLLPVYQRGTKNSREKPMTDEKLVQPGDVPNRFLDAQMFDKQPLKPGLSGLELEYRIVQLYSRDVGRREALLGFHVGQGTQDLGFRNSVPVLFTCVPAVEVALGIKDFDGTPTMAALTIRDKFGRVYPNPARRLAPDFFFHEQIYRADGESVHLPPGEYTAVVQRGPEYHVDTHSFVIGAKEEARGLTSPAQKDGQKNSVVTQRLDFKLRRWIHAAKRGWFSGDHHVHAAGCAHYDSPTEGVSPADMMRHILGEDLNVGCVLSWGPCWYTQKRHFEGKISALSRPNYLMRYDVEVSGFPSSHAGHLCLLKLTEDDYPSTTLLEEWPTWTQPVLEWGQKQGGVVGYSHSGWGLQLPDVMPDGTRQFNTHPWGGAPQNWQGKASTVLPDYAMPRFDGIGANEFIVTTAHGACDFISAVDTPAIWELNIWYHTLNCGMRTRISGETDFPCIYGDKVGLGRIYVQQPKDQLLNYDSWVQGLKDGRSYCGDGLSHLFDFKVNDFEVGTPSRSLGTPARAALSGDVATEQRSGKSAQPSASQLDLKQPGKVRVTCDATALLAEQPTPQTEAIRAKRLDEKPYWHLERSRIGETRTVPVELIVNGQPVAKQEIPADGSMKAVAFDYEIKHSSWVALRILPSCHTNPIFIEVAGKPIRASRKSADWCEKAVDVCWNSKFGRIRASERAAAKAAYDKAKEIYTAIAKDSVAE
ncbi:MAG: CehA/McbA family metallohydrolase [Planctomycetales bacterium]|nr:CehA/McbA family metallohydrolase [Planctomycetales bacterium]